MEIIEKIKRILLDCGIEDKIIDSNDFIREEILDSLKMAEIIIAIEDTFLIEIDAEEIIPENFMNVHTISKLTEKYLGIKQDME